MRVLMLAAMLIVGPAAATQAPLWLTPDPETILVIETTRGEVLVEMHPEFAPEAVARIKTLTRAGYYDGSPFERVVDGFVAQTGNPEFAKGGTSGQGDLPPEFTAKLAPEAGFVAATKASDGMTGYVRALPVATVSEAETLRRGEGTVQSWGAYCPGTAGFARDEAFDSANAQIFFMRGSARRLERLYTVWGVVIAGREAIDALAVGEPPASPDAMTRVRVLADIPEGERPVIAILNPASPQFRGAIDAARAARGADFTVCDVPVPVQVERP